MQFAGDFRDADDGALGSEDRRDGEGHLDERSVPALAHRVEVRHAEPVLHAIEGGVLFGASIGRDECGGGHSEGFVRGPAEQALGGRIPGRDRAVHVRTHDGVVGGRDNGGQAGSGVIRRAGHERLIIHGSRKASDRRAWLSLVDRHE